MSFDYASLITDRAVSDSDTLKALLGKPLTDWTEAERTAFNTAVLKGSYDYTDLNRVDACLEDLVARLGRMGYNVPGYQRVKLPRETKPASRLPEGYTEVQYIQSTGTQYVDTGFKPNQNTKIIADVQLSNTKSHVFGARTNWENNAFCLYWASNDGGCIQLANTHFNGGSFDVSARHVVSMSAAEFYMDGALKVSYSVDNFQCAQNAWIMSCYSSSASEYAQGKLYSCQIYDNGTLVRDYIPCINASGAVGLYDLVEGKFYGNSGTGVFFAGPRKVTLPEGFTQVEYIQSSGAQFLDTNIIPNSGTRVVMDFQLTSAGSTNQCLFGVIGQFSFRWYGSDSAFRSNGRNSVNFPTSISSTSRHIVDKTAIKTTIDQDASVTTTAGSCTLTLYLMAQRANSGASNYSSSKLFGCRIFDVETVIRDYIPCTNASGAAGLYDLVGQKFYGNAGTGSFTAGEAVTWSEDPEEPADDRDPYTWYESDVPTVPLLAQYRGNVAAIRAVLQLPEGTPEPPVTMAQLTTAGANSIEAVLLAVDLILNHIPAAVRHCGVTVCGSKGVMA